MRIFIDTNVLFSAILFRSGAPHLAYSKAVSHPNCGIVCERNIEELKNIFKRKAPHKVDSLDRFLALALPALEIAPVPNEASPLENAIRDVKDRVIFRAALHAKADVFLTGDKDFTESGIETPRILTPTEFLTLNERAIDWQ